MATLNDLVNDVYGHLSGYGVQSDPVTWLTSNLTATSTAAFTVNSTESAGRGVVEIDDELIWIDSFDGVSNALVPAPFGRGFRGSTAAAHTANTKVVFNPTFPRKDIVREINNTIMASFPKVKAISQTTFTYTPAVSTYALPSTIDEVLSISYQAIGPSKEWPKVKGWRMDGAADASAFSSNSSITLLSYIDPGAKVKVVYTTEPDLLESGSDSFADTTGFPESMRDVIVLGAAYRLLGTVDPAKLQYASPEGETQAARVSVGAAISAAKYLYALYQQRLQEESDKQISRYPVHIHYTN